MRRLLLALTLTAGFTSVRAAAQEPVTPVEVWRACLHPAAFPQDSFKVQSDSPPIPIAPDFNLRRLCNDLVLPSGSRRVVAAALMEWKNAGERGRRRLPSADEIRDRAENASADLAKWQQERRGSQVGRAVNLIEGSTIVFPPEMADLAPGDSANIRRLAEAIRILLAASNGDTIEIQASTDSTGSAAGNRELANRRAANVLQAVLKADNRIDFRRVRAVGVPLPSGRGRVAYVANSQYTPAEKVVDRATVAKHIPGVLLPPANVASNSGGEIAQASTSTTGTSISMVTALTDVVIQTANEQVQMYLVETVTKDFCRPPSTYAAQFQRTCALFWGSPAPSYLPSLSAFRSAVREDFVRSFPAVMAQNLDTHGLDLLQAPNSKRNQAAVAYLLLSYMPMVADGEDPLRALGELSATTPPEWIKNTPTYSIIRQVRPVVDAYRQASRELAASPTALADHGRDLLLFSLRAGAVNAADPGVTLPDVAASQALTEVFQDTLNLRRVITAGAGIVAVAEEMREARRRGDFDFASLAPVERIRRAGALYTSLANLLLASVEPAFPAERDLADLRAVAVPTRDLVTALAAGEYRTALLQASSLSLLFVDTPARRAARPAGSDMSANGEGKETPKQKAAREAAENTARTEDRAQERRRQARVRLNQQQLRVFSLAVDLAQAPDQRSANEALRRYVGQGRTYRAKRLGDDRGFVTVNAYLGAAGGWEREKEADDWTGQAAVYLPVGVELGRRFERRPTLLPWTQSLSAFVQVLDLGAVAAFRLRSDEEDTPDPELSQVFSPGVFLVTSVFKTPFSVGAGFSVAPRARLSAEQTSPDGSLPPRERRDAVRFSIIAAADVPLFP